MTPIITKTKTKAPKLPFNPSYYPTFLRVKGTSGFTPNNRKIPIDGSKISIQFETDAPDDYIYREDNPGDIKIDWPNELDGSSHGPYDGIITVYLNTTNKSPILGNSVGDLNIQITTNARNPLPCDVGLHYGDKKPGPPKKPKEPKQSGLSIPKPDLVHKDRWNEFNWNGDNIAKADPDCIHINMDNTILEEFKKGKHIKDEKKLNYNFLVYIWFFSITLDYQLFELDNYDEAFKKSMLGITQSILPLIMDLNIAQLAEVIIKEATIQNPR